MRIPGFLRRRLSAGIFILILVLGPVIPVSAGDTGTYRIENYEVTLAPQNDGRVRITYEQEWQVLSGSIPWITVGLANDNFGIETFSGAATELSPVRGGGFTGVRVDLDRGYQPGETFRVIFTVLQGNLLERLPEEERWRISFTPGWYDNAETGELKVSLISPVGIETYDVIEPSPASTTEGRITWERVNLSPGERFNIRVESLDGRFLTEEEPGQAREDAVWSPVIFIIAGIILVLGILIYWAIRKNRQARDEELRRRVAETERAMALDREKREKIEKGFAEYVESRNIEPDAEGRYYDRSYGGYITPAIWAAVILSQNQAQKSPPGKKPPGSSCACACVSCACACACACAGGGAAGCSRKTAHECRSCRNLLSTSQTFLRPVTANKVENTVQDNKSAYSTHDHGSRTDLIAGSQYPQDDVHAIPGQTEKRHSEQQPERTPGHTHGQGDGNL
jgi:hypothetical protein